MVAVYVCIILAATVIGAICGMGGGVIIKPLLDAVSSYSTFQIGIISGACVLAMSVSSLIKHIASKTSFKAKTVLLLSAGSVAGGLLGDLFMGLIRGALGSGAGGNTDSVIKIVQNGVLAVMLAFVLVYMIFLKPKNIGFHCKNGVLIALAGMLLGIISTFLDIGGGPVNICVFCLFFGMTTKEAAVNSLVTIFFAQLTKMIKQAADGSFINNVLFDGSLPVWAFAVMVVFAVVGGLTGAVLNKKMSSKSIDVLYCAAIVVVIGIDIFNIVGNAVAI